MDRMIKEKIRKIYEHKIKQLRNDAVLAAGITGILSAFSFTAMVLKYWIDATILLMAASLSLGFLVAKVIDIINMKDEMKEMLKDENYE
jgi:hypothetical protein